MLEKLRRGIERFVCEYGIPTCMYMYIKFCSALKLVSC